MTRGRCDRCATPTGTGALLCDRCAALAAALLHRVPQVVAELVAAEARASRATDPRAARRADAAVRQLGADLAPLAAAAVPGWPTLNPDVLPDVRAHRARQVARTRPDGQVHTARAHPDDVELRPPLLAEVAAAALLRRPLAPVIDAARFDALSDAVNTAAAAIERGGLTRAGQCPTCGADRWLEPGVLAGACPFCGDLWSAPTREAAVLAGARAQLLERGPLLAAVAAYTGTPVPDATWARWRRTGALRPRAWLRAGKRTTRWVDRRDPPLFRVGDVLDLLDSIG